MTSEENFAKKALQRCGHWRLIYIFLWTGTQCGSSILFIYFLGFFWTFLKVQSQMHRRFHNVHAQSSNAHTQSTITTLHAVLRSSDRWCAIVDVVIRPVNIPALMSSFAAMSSLEESHQTKIGFPSEDNLNAKGIDARHQSEFDQNTSKPVSCRSSGYLICGGVASWCTAFTAIHPKSLPNQPSMHIISS